MTCNRIQRLIDEADKPEALPYTAASHIAVCPTCSQFAEERTTLRAFLIDLPRVNAPANFDAMLKMRLAGSKAAKPFSWFTPGFTMRFGAVAAVALVAVLSVPYFNNFSVAPLTANNASIGLYQPDLTAIAELARQKAIKEASVNIDGSGSTSTVAASTQPRIYRGIHSEPKSSEGLAKDLPIIIVSDQDTFSMPMLPVSVGAQQQMMMRSSRPAPKPLAVSF